MTLVLRTDSARVLCRLPKFPEVKSKFIIKSSMASTLSDAMHIEKIIIPTCSP